MERFGEMLSGVRSELSEIGSVLAALDYLARAIRWVGSRLTRSQRLMVGAYFVPVVVWVLGASYRQDIAFALLTVTAVGGISMYICDSALAIENKTGYEKRPYLEMALFHVTIWPMVQVVFLAYSTHWLV